MNIFICEDSPEGIFTGVYDGWAGKKGHENVKLVTAVEEYELFGEYRTVAADEEKAAKVLRTVCNRLGQETYECLYRAMCADDPEKADAVYHTIAVGLSVKNGRDIMNHLSNPYVAKVFALDRKVRNEAWRFVEFLRFQELKNGVLYAKIGAENKVLPLIAPHFADRLVNENFLIYDHKHGDSIVHEKQKPWVLVKGEEMNEDFTKQYSEQEEFYQELFTQFSHTISIKERENPRLQMQMLPLKFRKYMTEFSESKRKSNFCES